MSNRRVKAVDYDDDGYDSFNTVDYDDNYPEEDSQELSEEDRSKLQEGTLQTRQALGPDISATDKEIQDALWHYYYDIAKTVTYVKNLRNPPPKKSKKEPQAQANLHEDAGLYPLPTLPITAADFFSDTPWGGVSIFQLANLIHEPQLPLGTLLGGSSRTSKLANLAAARRKKEAEKAADSQASNEVPAGRTMSLLDRLRSKKENMNIAPNTTENSKTLVFPSRQKKSSPERQSSIDVRMEDAADANVIPTSPREEVKAKPSIFAQIILGKHEEPRGGVLLTEIKSTASTRTTNDRHFRLPYLDDPDFVSRNPFTKPSPDDVVLRAQRNKSAAHKSKPAIEDGNGVAADVAALKISDGPKPRSKNLNVLEEYNKSTMKDAASFVVVGHVDHGKSTLMGRLLYDLGVIDEKHVEKLRRDSKKIGKASFALAWVMDSSNDERERGVTVDVATNHFETDKTRFTILDAPGHQDFIPNMIAGASQADFAVLVIDASTNSFESGLRGQTKEHALLVRSMGVQRLIVAVNKMDMCDWSEERFGEIKTEMSTFLKTSNFSSKSVSFIPCAGLSGENITKPPGTPNASWYKGPTLVAELDNADPTRRAIEKPLRMTVSEVFRSSLNNPVSVSGRLDSGSLQVGDVLRFMPSGESALVKSLDADGGPAEWAVAGQIAVLNLSDIDPVHIRPGDIACHPQSPVLNVKSLTAKILAFEHIMPMFVDVHRGAMHAVGKIESLVAVLDKTTGEVVRKKPKVVQPGMVARVVVEMEEALPLEGLVKVILRADGKTVAAGMVE